MQNEISSLLEPSDLEFCKHNAARYNSTKQLFEDLSSTTYNQMQSHLELRKKDRFEVFELPISIGNMFDYYDNLKSVLQDRFISHIENYFTIKYRISFQSFTTTESYSEFTLLDSFIPIVENIMNQLGKNIRQAGTINRLIELRKSLAIQGKPYFREVYMVFPESFDYDLDNGKLPYLTETRNLSLILSAIGIFTTGNNSLSAQIEESIYTWENHFHFNFPYIIDNKVRFSFNTEKAILVVFPDTVNAALFWYQFLHAEAS